MDALAINEGSQQVSLTQRLEQEKKMLEGKLEEIEAAIKVLSDHAEIASVVDVITKLNLTSPRY